MLRVGQTILSAETRPSQYSSQYSLIGTFPILLAGVSHFQPCVRSSTVPLILAVSLTLAVTFINSRSFCCAEGDLVSISRTVSLLFFLWLLLCPRNYGPLGFLRITGQCLQVKDFAVFYLRHLVPCSGSFQDCKMGHGRLPFCVSGVSRIAILSCLCIVLGNCCFM